MPLLPFPGDLREMAKRRVPAALHHELSEYASLLRALRVRDAMDVTKYLVKPSPFALTTDEDLFCTPGAGPSDLTHPTNVQPHTKSPKAKGKQKVVSEPPRQTRRDHWTRWPLPLEDVLLPEWTLQDEVAVIATQVMKSRRPIKFPVPIYGPGGPKTDIEDQDEALIQVMDMDIEPDEPEPPHYVAYVTSIVAKYLATIFSILASHTPARPASMQNRIEPLNWRAVIDVVVSCGIPEFTNPKVVENVIKRMEAIYGPSILPIEGRKATSFRAVERMRGKDAALQRFEKVLDNARANYFTQASPPPRRSPSPEPMVIKKKRMMSVAAAKEEADYKARTKTTSKIPGRGRGRGRKRRGTEEPLSTQQQENAGPVDPSVTATTDQVVRRSARTKTKDSHLEITPHSLGE